MCERSRGDNVVHVAGEKWMQDMMMLPMMMENITFLIRFGSDAAEGQGGVRTIS